jgi:hypothetical protein
VNKEIKPYAVSEFEARFGCQYRCYTCKHSKSVNEVTFMIMDCECLKKRVNGFDLFCGNYERKNNDD